MKMKMNINRKIEIEKIYSLSPMQDGMLFHYLLDPDSPAYFEQTTFTISGDIDYVLLENSFNVIIDNYEILRTIFRYENVKQPLQIVLKGRPLSIHVEDISHLIQADAKQYVKEFQEKDRERGFDLTKDMLVRISLLKTGENTHKLVWSFHHILMDGWCLAILYRQLIRVYQRICKGESLELEKIPPYQNYIKWLKKKDKEEGLNYWKDYLAGYESFATLPKFVPPMVNIDKTYQSREHVFWIDEGQTEGMMNIAHQNQVTVNTVFQLMWGVLLQRYNNTDDVVFGAVVSGRPSEITGIEKMIGLFINTIPVRVTANDNVKQISQLLKKMQYNESLSKSYEYLPLAEIQSGSLLRGNLIDHIMIFENYPIQEEVKHLENQEPLQFRIEKVEVFEQTNYDFNIIVGIGMRSLVKLSYNAFVYECTMVERIEAHLRELIRQVIENPSLEVNEIELLSETEKVQLLVEFNDTRVEYLRGKTVFQLFEEQVEKTPCSIAVVCRDINTGEYLSLPYYQLSEKSNRLARMLKEKGGKPNTVVGLMTERTVEMLIGLLAILKIGAAYLPIGPEYPEERIKYMLKHSQTEIVMVTNPESLHEPGVLFINIDINELEDRKIDSSNLPVVNSSTDLAYLIYTSGTTGKPKGVMIENRAVVNFINGITNVIPFRENDGILSLTTLSFDIFGLEILLPLTRGSKVVIGSTEEQLDSAAAASVIENENITILQLTPSRLQLYMSDPEAAARLKLLNYLLVGGEAFPEFLLEETRKVTEGNVFIYNMYGPTETTIWSTLKDVSAVQHLNIGKPIANTQVYILHKTGLLQPIGIPGELYIGGDGVARGYVNSPELTAQKFQSPRRGQPIRKVTGSKIYKTGDLARWLPDGNIEFLGRFDYQVKVRGYRIELDEIEYHLQQHSDVKEAVVVVKEQEKGSHLCAYIVPTSPSSLSSMEDDTAQLENLKVMEWKEYLAEILPNYMIPSYFVQLEKIPLTLNGKIDRNALPEPEMRLSPDTVVAPRDKIERKFVEIWADVLDVNKNVIGIDSNFFELGGHSLRATRMISKIHKAFHVRIPLTEIFKIPSIRKLSRYIEGATEQRFASIAQAEKKEFYVLSSVQKRLYILQQMESGGASYNIPQVVLLEGHVDKDKLDEVFRTLVIRHESLRTSFELIEEEPFQRIHDNTDFAIEYYDLAETNSEQSKSKHEYEEYDEEMSRSDFIIQNEFVQHFDLSQAPLMRVGLIREADGRYILMVDIHHIIADGTSIGILITEFKELYSREKLLPLRIQYKDFSEWQSSERQSQEVRHQEAYWLKCYEGEIPVLNLPTDFPRPAVQSFQGENVNFEIHSEVTKILNQLALASEATMFMVLLSIFNVFLSKISGQEEIIIGSAIAGRRHENLQPLVGMFVNTFALKNFPQGAITFKEFLADVKERTLGAYENQDYQFEDLVDRLALNREASRNPLFDVVFALQNIEKSWFEIPGIKIRRLEYQNKTSKFDITLTVREVGERLVFSIEYDTFLFKKETIQRFIHFFNVIISSVIKNPGIRLSDIDLLTEEDKSQLLDEFNASEVQYPAKKTLHQLFEEQVEKSPGVVSIWYENRTMTYRELNRRANQLARILVRKGLKPDTIVGIIQERSIDLVIAMLAVLKVGSACFMIEPDTPMERITYMLEECQTPLLLTNTTSIKDLSFTHLQNPRFSKIEPRITGIRPQIVDLDRLPRVDRTLVDYEKYNPYIGDPMVKNTYITMQATRGCPFNCAYCHKIWPKSHIFRSAENIFEEVRFYYEMGVRRFSFVDDVFNLNIRNSKRFYQLLIENGLDVQLFFPSGFRGDILTEDYIDLMIEAGTVLCGLALETASPRLQKLIGKNLNLNKFRQNAEYFCKKHPQVILEFQTMLGFPTETKEEALMTLDFVKSLEWLHFPYVNILRIYPNTDMERLAIENGITSEAILRSEGLAYHQLPETLPFDKEFTTRYQNDFLNNYFLSKKRLKYLLPFQAKVLTKDEMVQKYNSYLPAEINCFEDLLHVAGISGEELGIRQFLDEDHMLVPNLDREIGARSPVNKPDDNALRILLLDLSQLFLSEGGILYDLAEPPLGLLSLMTYLNKTFGSKINGKIAKSRFDFENFYQLKTLIQEFKPDLMGIRTLTFYKEFFHRAIALIRQWGIDVPIISGGPYATSNFPEVLQNRHIDLVVLGEGEITFAELIGKMLDNQGKLPPQEVLKEIKGLVFRPKTEPAERNLYCLSREIIMMDGLSEELDKESYENLRPIAQSSNLAFTIFTSGSTGAPKGTLLNHYGISNHTFTKIKELGLQQGDVLCQNLNISFVASIWQFFAPLFIGATFQIYPNDVLKNPYELFKRIEGDGIHVVEVVPSVLMAYLELLGGGKEKMGLNSLRMVVLTGEKVPVSLVEKFYQYYPHDRIQLVNAYGQSECSDDTLHYKIPADTKLHTIPIGKPSNNTAIYVLDKNNHLQPVGILGQLHISGDGLAVGYLNRPEFTAETFIDNHLFPGQKMYCTGDMARWQSDGNIQFLGRIDSQVKIRGYRVELGEIENQLLLHKGVKEVAVIAKEDSNDKSLWAFYVTSDIDATAVSGTHLRDYLGLRLPDYMLPSYFISLPELPLMPSGKVDRKALVSIEPEVSGERKAAPIDEIEEKLSRVWADVLKKAPHMVDIDSNFFDDGGNSLNAVSLVSKIHKELDVEIPLTEVFEMPTIRQLAQYIRNAVINTYEAIETAAEKDYYPLSSAQTRLYFLHRIPTTGTSYNTPQVIILEGHVDIPKIEDTFVQLIERHEGLRTSFEMVGQNPMQKIHLQVPFHIEYDDLEAADSEMEQKDSIQKSVDKFIRPFDLGQPPLIRIGLVNLNWNHRSTQSTECQNKNRHLLMADMPHIIADGTSMGILIREFTALYEGQPLLPLRIQYKDFAEWQHSERQKQKLKRQEAFWLDMLDGNLSLLELPTDFQRPSVQSFEGSHLSFQLEPEESSALREMASKEDVTLFMVLLSIYNILLARVTGQEDILVGVPISGRSHADLQNIIGMFVNTLVLRNVPKRGETFNGFLTDVRKRTLDAFENQDYPFENLVENLPIKRNLSRNPLVDAGFQLQNIEKSQFKIPGVKLLPYMEYEHKISKGDISLHAVESGDMIFFTFEYCTKLFKKETIERFIRYFKEIAAAVIEDNDIKLEDIEISHELITLKSDVTKIEFAF
jgi:acyl carrier protein